MSFLRELVNQLGIQSEHLFVGMAGAILLMFIIQIILSVRISKQKKRITQFMEGSDAKSLEGIVKEKLDEFEKLKESIEVVGQRVDKLDEAMLTTYRKSAIVKYDAFKEMGGKLSFAVALLNESNNGFIINSMHSSREGCFTYIKEIIDGKSFVTLADEEKKVLEEAIASTNYME